MEQRPLQVVHSLPQKVARAGQGRAGRAWSSRRSPRYAGTSCVGSRLLRSGFPPSSPRQARCSLQSVTEPGPSSSPCGSRVSQCPAPPCQTGTPHSHTVLTRTGLQGDAGTAMGLTTYQVSSLTGTREVMATPHFTFTRGLKGTSNDGSREAMAAPQPRAAPEACAQRGALPTLRPWNSSSVGPGRASRMRGARSPWRQSLNGP